MEDPRETPSLYTVALTAYVEKLKIEIDEKMEQLRAQSAAIQESSLQAQLLSRNLSTQQADLEKRLEGFYSRQIEMFGLFIAIFSFIIAGIQIAGKAEGDAIEMLGKSLALFTPLTLCIVMLLVTIRWTSRR